MFVSLLFDLREYCWSRQAEEEQCRFQVLLLSVPVRPVSPLLLLTCNVDASGEKGG